MVVFTSSKLTYDFVSYNFCSCSLADFLFKFLVIGSAGTGKSCILHQFIEGKCELPIGNAFYV